MTKTAIKTTIKPNMALKEPPLYKIVYLNDEVTTMNFVLSSLVTFFNYSEDTAMDITENIHQNGSAVVAVLPFEIAEQKEVEVTTLARKSGFPLKIKLESEAL
jgi:ATP-dependent Clp protease adaptor protein ClpS